MKSYNSQITKVKEKIAALKAAGKGYSAQELQKKLNSLEIPVSHGDEAKAEKASEALKEFADEVEVPKVEAQVKDSLSKKK
jgi:tyrosyl-tRNA synthetase